MSGNSLVDENQWASERKTEDYKKGVNQDSCQAPED
jgi:hypothetical protein